MREKLFTFSLPKLVIFTFDIQICSRRYSFPTLFPLNQKFLRLSYPIPENRRHCAYGRTDGRSATLNAAPTEGHVIIEEDCL